MGFGDVIKGVTGIGKEGGATSGYSTPEAVQEMIRNSADYKAEQARLQGLTLRQDYLGNVGRPSRDVVAGLESVPVSQPPSTGQSMGSILRPAGITTNVLPGIKDSSEIPGVVASKGASPIYWIAGAAILGYFLLKRGKFI